MTNTIKSEIENCKLKIEKSLTRYKNCPTCHYNNEEEVCKAELATLQKCQKILEERDKDELEFLDNLRDDTQTTYKIPKWADGSILERISKLKEQTDGNN